LAAAKDPLREVNLVMVSDAFAKTLVVGFALIFIGMLVIMLGSLYMLYRGVKEGGSSVEGGGIVFIGPIPIVWGTTKTITKLMLVLAIVLTATLALLYLLAFRMKPA